MCQNPTSQVSDIICVGCVPDQVKHACQQEEDHWKGSEGYVTVPYLMYGSRQLQFSYYYDLSHLKKSKINHESHFFVSS